MNYKTTKWIEVTSFVSLFVIGIFLSRSDEVAIQIANFFSGYIDYSIKDDPKIFGIFIGVLIFGAFTRSLILIVMQYLISNKLNLENIVIEYPLKIVFLKVIQIIVTILIFLLIFNTAAYQQSLSGLMDSWISIFATTLLIHIFFGAVGDAFKQIIFVLFKS